MPHFPQHSTALCSEGRTSWLQPLRGPTDPPSPQEAVRCALPATGKIHHSKAPDILLLSPQSYLFCFICINVGHAIEHLKLHKSIYSLLDFSIQGWHSARSNICSFIRGNKCIIFTFTDFSPSSLAV